MKMRIFIDICMCICIHTRTHTDRWQETSIYLNIFIWHKCTYLYAYIYSQTYSHKSHETLIYLHIFVWHKCTYSYSYVYTNTYPHTFLSLCTPETDSRHTQWRETSPLPYTYLHILTHQRQTHGTHNGGRHRHFHIHTYTYSHTRDGPTAHTTAGNSNAIIHIFTHTYTSEVESLRTQLREISICIHIFTWHKCAFINMHLYAHIYIYILTHILTHVFLCVHQRPSHGTHNGGKHQHTHPITAHAMAGNINTLIHVLTHNRTPETESRHTQWREISTRLSTLWHSCSRAFRVLFQAKIFTKLRCCPRAW